MRFAIHDSPRLKVGKKLGRIFDAYEREIVNVVKKYTAKYRVG